MGEACGEATNRGKALGAHELRHLFLEQAAIGLAPLQRTNDAIAHHRQPNHGHEGRYHYEHEEDARLLGEHHVD